MLVSTRRQAEALRLFAGALESEDNKTELILKAEALQSAIVALSSLAGRYDIDEVYDAIFGRFCIGK